MVEHHIAIEHLLLEIITQHLLDTMGHYFQDKLVYLPHHPLRIWGLNSLVFALHNIVYWVPEVIQLAE